MLRNQMERKNSRAQNACMAGHGESETKGPGGGPPNTSRDAHAKTQAARRAAAACVANRSRKRFEMWKISAKSPDRTTLEQDVWVRRQQIPVKKPNTWLERRKSGSHGQFQVGHMRLWASTLCALRGPPGGSQEFRDREQERNEMDGGDGLPCSRWNRYA